MMLIKRTYLNWLGSLVLIFGVQLASMAQEKGEVRFFVDNENGYFEILINDTLLLKQWNTTLPAGQHQAQVWSYGYEIKDVSFTVQADSANEVFVKLDRSAPYLAYEESYRKYRMDFHKSITVPISLTLAFAVTSGTFMLRGYDLKKQIELDIESYHMSPQPDEIEAIKLSVEENNKKYNNYRTGYYITGACTLLGIAGSIYTGVRFRNNALEPVYSKSSPFEKRTGLYFSPAGFSFIYRIG